MRFYDWWRLGCILLAAFDFGLWQQSVYAGGFAGLVLALWDTRKEGGET